MEYTFAKSENEITDPSGIISPVFPLKVGNKWTFRDKHIQADGSLWDAGSVTQTIVGEKLIDGEKWFLLSPAIHADELITARQDGIYSYYSHLKTAVLKYKYPVFQGEQYVSGYDVNPRTNTGYDTLVNFRMSVISTNEIISVLHGQYICQKYHAPMVPDIPIDVASEDIFLSNIGPVKRVFYSSDGLPSSYWELVSTKF